MRNKNTRKALKELSKKSSANGIDMLVEPKKGKGSHKGLWFRDRKTGEELHFVISGKKEISSGVVRNVSKYLADLSLRVDLAAILKKIWDSVFES